METMKYVTKEFANVNRLNRTMQYGNQNNISRPQRENSFKSYYVVWKPIRLRVTNNSGAPGLNRTMQYGNVHERQPSLHPYTWFKSYYVVWKPERWKEIDEGKEEFKSYYVVWKPSP